MLNLLDKTITHVIVEENGVPYNQRFKVFLHEEFLRFMESENYRRLNHNDGWKIRRVIWKDGRVWTQRNKFDHHYMAC